MNGTVIPVPKYTQKYYTAIWIGNFGVVLSIRAKGKNDCGKGRKMFILVWEGN